MPPGLAGGICLAPATVPVLKPPKSIGAVLSSGDCPPVCPKYGKGALLLPPPPLGDPASLARRTQSAAASLLPSSLAGLTPKAPPNFPRPVCSWLFMVDCTMDSPMLWNSLPHCAPHPPFGCFSDNIFPRFSQLLSRAEL